MVLSVKGIFIVETPISKVKSGKCRAKRSGIGKVVMRLAENERSEV
jgi:hypothetical protein